MGTQEKTSSLWDRVASCCGCCCKACKGQEEIRDQNKTITVLMNPMTGGPEGPPENRPLPSPPKSERYIALFDYSARTENDLTFNTGDILEVLDTSAGEWWIARAVNGISMDKRGYIPANYVAPVESIDAEPWYFPDTKRLDAEKLLQAEGNQEGAFLVRNSESLKGEYSLSVLHQGRAKHYKLQKLDNGHYYVSKTKSFPTLKELVEYYSRQSDGLCVLLGEPCRKVNYNMQETCTMDPEDFLAEAQLMKRLRHPKLIQLYAVCTMEEPIYIITELMKHGSLLDYLRKDKGNTLRVQDQIEMAAQIAAGMAYLEQQNYIHRDLAARNVLVGENNICKVADFGLARVFMKESESVYEARDGGKFPVKWTAPEAIHNNKFSIKSDVWSFGILLYEIMTFGQMPYPTMTNMQAVQWISGGNRLACPPRCPKPMHLLMLDCWSEKELNRPTFETLQWQLEDYFDMDLNSYDDSYHY
ncbi:tyrosine-protein kinase FRK [Poecilia reticulata]|uniref:tyrosine-protein kinase FRK n=1 Tax=Poecilia reticulata TaxID=8081 RepID=UPI0007EBB7AF|nr:PREDICTED: tyrosine-protein kinase FRK [Poecilia reticulata]